MEPEKRRQLTGLEMDAILASISAAPSPNAGLQCALRGTFEALLAPLGESIVGYEPHRRLQVTDFAIPIEQWNAIAGALLTKTTGSIGGALMLTEWANLGPAGYEEP